MKFLVLLTLTALPLCSWSSTAVQLVLGRTWFSKTNLGESNCYLMRELNTRTFEPLGSRIADNIFQNREKLDQLLWMVLLLFLWNSLLSLSLIFKYMLGLRCRASSI